MVGSADIPASKGLISYNSACAAAGQLGLMSLYESMFAQLNITVSQILVTSSDFASPERRRNIQYVISQLLALGIVPLLNENDAVSANQGYETFGCTFSDNDSLAALVAVETNAQLLVLLTDVAGVYDRPPSEAGAQIIDVFRESTDFKVGQKSTQGRGGMGAKVGAALSAIKGGVNAVVVAAGEDSGVIGKILNGDKVGTLFLPELSIEAASSLVHIDQGSGTAMNVDQSSGIEGSTQSHSIEAVAVSVRDSSRQLQGASAATRTAILLKLAQYIDERQEAILKENAVDLQSAVTRYDSPNNHGCSFVSWYLLKQPVLCVIYAASKSQSDFWAAIESPEAHQGEAGLAESGHPRHRRTRGSHRPSKHGFYQICSVSSCANVKILQCFAMYT